MQTIYIVYLLDNKLNLLRHMSRIYLFPHKTNDPHSHKTHVPQRSAFKFACNKFHPTSTHNQAFRIRKLRQHPNLHSTFPFTICFRFFKSPFAVKSHISVSTWDCFSFLFFSLFPFSFLVPHHNHPTYQTQLCFMMCVCAFPCDFSSFLSLPYYYWPPDHHHPPRPFVLLRICVLFFSNCRSRIH